MIVGALQGDEALQFHERFRTVVHTQIENAILPGLARRFAGHHDERGRLPAANIAADFLSRVQRREHSIRQVAFGGFEGLGHRRPDFVVRHQVSLHGKIFADEMPGGGDVVGGGAEAADGNCAVALLQEA